MALSPDLTDSGWKKMVTAEVRTLYFGDLANYFSVRKQTITGCTFIASSGAIVTLAARLEWAPLVLSVISAFLMAYSLAVSLDTKALAMAKLHTAWSTLASDYERLWNHWYDEDAESTSERLLARDRELSETGTTEAPTDLRRIEKWRDFVNEQHGIPA